MYLERFFWFMLRIRIGFRDRTACCLLEFTIDSFNRNRARAISKDIILLRKDKEEDVVESQFQDSVEHCDRFRKCVPASSIRKLAS